MNIRYPIYEGVYRILTIQERNRVYYSSGPGSEHLAGHGHELLFEHVPGTDDGYRSRTGHQGGHDRI